MENQPTSQKSAISNDDVFNAIVENIDYFTALYEDGDTMTLFLSNGKVDQRLSKVKNGFQNHILKVGKHDYTTTNKLKFARWCGKQLKAGHTLTIGYDEETGTY